MAQYLHKFDTESAFDAAYNGNDYHEPWVSYTLEEGTSYPEVTAFTWSLDTYYDLDLTGEFKYIGDYYMPGTNPETRESTYDTTLVYYYYPIWSNGKSYVYPGDSNWNPIRNVMVAGKIFSVNFDAQHPGFLGDGVGGVEGRYEEKLAKAIEPKQVAYNKNENAIYLTWDGVSMTKLREGTQNEAEYPTYIVDQAKSKGDVKRARVYINDELAYTLSDCNNSHTVRSLGSYTDFIIFGYDTNGNRTCTYSWFIKFI